MATYSRQDLRDAVLGELGIVDPNEAPSAEDAKLADDRCQQMLELAYENGLIWWELDSGAIPARAFLSLVQWIAYRLVMPYGALTRAAILQANAETAETILYDLADAANVGLRQNAEYF